MDEWREIAGYEGLYEIHPDGSVKSLQPSKRFPANHVLTPRSSGAGYKVVGLYKNKKQKTRYIHHLVMETFVGPRPKGAHINHKNGNKSDNGLLNLEYCTPRENSNHAWNNGLLFQAPSLIGAANGNAKITEQTAIEIKSLLDKGIPAMTISRQLSVSANTVYDIKSGRKWKHLAEAA